MFIKDGVYRSVDVSGLTAPIAEGTILTETGAIAAANGSDAYGIVPENVYVMPPTKIINVAVGGIIDLLDPANANVTLSEAVMTKLGEDFNFVQFNENTGGGVPEPSVSDAGKVLTVVTEYETGAEAIPAQTVTIAQGTATVQNANVSQWTEGQSLQVIYRGTMYTGKITDAEGSLVFGTDDFALSYDSSTGVLTVEDIEHSGDNSISAQYVTEHVNADWGEGVPTPTAADTDKVLTAKKTGYKKGTVIIPEQTITTTGDHHDARISNYDTDLWVFGQKVIVCVNDMEYESVLNDSNGIADFYSNDGDYSIILENYLNFHAPTNDEYVVSAYICKDVYGYVPDGLWDAVIRLTHSNDSSQDLPDNLTPSIVSGSHSELTAKINNGGYPSILVEYYHPWGYRFAVPMAYISYASADVISMQIVGTSPMADWAVSNWGLLSWRSNDTIVWG